MIKNFFAVFLFFLFSMFAQSQENRQFNGGLILGINTSQINGDKYKGFNKFGPQGGAFVSWPLKKNNLTTQIELLYQRLGSHKPSNPAKGIFNSYKITLHYISMPLMLKFKYKKLRLQAGLIGGYLFNHYEENQTGVLPVEMLNYNSTDLRASVGLMLPINKKLDFIWRGSTSIKAIADSREISRFGLVGGSLNEVLEFSLSYSFLEN